LVFAWVDGFGCVETTKALRIASFEKGSILPIAYLAERFFSQ